MLSTQTQLTQPIHVISRPQTTLRLALALGLCALLFITSPTAHIKAQQDPLPPPATAETIAATTHYVSPGANCGGQSPCYATPQAAVDAAADGDTIKVGAGTYTTVAFEVIRVYSKSLELLAGYSPANWNAPDPLANKTILDPQNVRGVRGIVAQGATYTSPVTVTIKGFTVVNGVNSPPQSCGGICAVFANVDISNNYLYSNTAASIQVGGATGTIYNNLVQDTRTDSFTSSNMGIAVESSVITVISNTVRRNGTGIRSFSQGGVGVVSYIYNNLVENNAVGIASEHGDAMEARYNQVHGNARGIRARDHLIPFTYPTLLTITDNVIDNSSNVGVELNFVMLGNITNNFVVYNKVGISHNAGAGSTLSITTNLVDHNTNGGIHFVAFVPNTVFNILSNTVTYNGTSGISAKGSKDTIYVINGNWIENNKPESKIDVDSGGGLYVGGDATVTISHNRIARNATNRYGGGIYLDGPENKSTPRVTMSANLILTNTAQETGSGFAMGGGIVTATNDIISRNYQERPAVYVFLDKAASSILNANHWTIGNNGSNGIRAFFGGKVKITNSIVAGHRIAALAESVGGELIADNILSFDNPLGVCDIAGTCTNIFEGDPKFLSDKLLNFHITADSSAIDKATATDVTDDIDGPGRPVGAASDLGADEYGNAVIKVYDLFLPITTRQDEP